MQLFVFQLDTCCFRHNKLSIWIYDMSIWICEIVLSCNFSSDGHLIHGPKVLLFLLKDYSRLIVYLGVNVPLRLRTSDLRSPFCKSPIDCYWITKVNELKYLKCHYKYDFKTFEVFEEKLVYKVTYCDIKYCDIIFTFWVIIHHINGLILQ